MTRPVAALTRVRRLLHVLFGASVAATLIGAALQVAHGFVAESIAALALVVIAVVAWRFRMTDRYARAASVILALSGIGASVFVDALGFPLLFTALIVTVVDWGMWLGVILGVAMTGVWAALLHQHTDGDPTVILGQSLVNAVLVGLVLIFAGVLRAFDAQHDELLAVNAQLNAAMEAQRDLVLAEERARAAAELHDGLGHQLTLISMSLDYADRMRDRDPARAWDEIANASVASRQALADMRLWVRALHPARLDQLTDPRPFVAMADVFRGTGLYVKVEVATDEQLDGPRGLFAYRLIQEGLTNALRHARATKVIFRIDRDDADATLHLTVGDNGTGSGELQPGYGLRGLIERAEALDGRLTLRRPGILGGLDVCAELPVGAGLPA